MKHTFSPCLPPVSSGLGGPLSPWWEGGNEQPFLRWTVLEPPCHWVLSPEVCTSLDGGQLQP